MTSEDAAKFIEQLLRDEQPLTRHQSRLITELWKDHNKNYTELHTITGISEDLLRQAGSTLFRLLEERFGYSKNHFHKKRFPEFKKNLEGEYQKYLRDPQEYLKNLKNKNSISETYLEEPESTEKSTYLSQEKKYVNFVQRTNESQQILAQLEDKNANKVISLVGLGGIGKTALCHHIASQAYQNKFIQRVIWIKAKKQQFDPFCSSDLLSYREYTLTLKEALKEIGIQIPTVTTDILESPERLKNAIAKYLGDAPNLVVIDGLEDSENPQILAEELGKLLGKSRLILTTRKEVRGYTFQCDVNKMNPEDSKIFLQTIAKEVNCQTFLNAKNEEKEKILSLTDGMPLAMKLVVSNVRYHGINRTIEKLSSATEESILYDYIFEDAWQELNQRDEIDAQLLIMILAAESEPTQRDLLYDIEIDHKKTLSKVQVDHALKLLKELSLIEITDNLISLHSLTVQYFGEKLQNQYE